MTNNNELLQAMNCSVSGQNIDYSSAFGTLNAGDNYSLTSASSTSALNTVYIYDPPNTLWGYWQNIYYPQVIRESYPIYIQEKAMDKGKQAFELLKALMDKGLVKVDKVKDFIEAMDTILKTL